MYHDCDIVFCCECEQQIFLEKLDAEACLRRVAAFVRAESERLKGFHAEHRVAVQIADDVDELVRDILA